MKKEIKDSFIIQAELLKETSKAWLLDCEGDVHWFPKQFCIFDAKKKELEAPRWILREKFPEESY